jgi:hypothetical protein
MTGDDLLSPSQDSRRFDVIEFCDLDERGDIFASSPCIMTQQFIAILLDRMRGFSWSRR